MYDVSDFICNSKLSVTSSGKKIVLQFSDKATSALHDVEDGAGGGGGRGCLRYYPSKYEHTFIVRASSFTFMR